MCVSVGGKDRTSDRAGGIGAMRRARGTRSSVWLGGLAVSRAGHRASGQFPRTLLGVPGKRAKS